MTSRHQEIDFDVADKEEKKKPEEPKPEPEKLKLEEEEESGDEHYFTPPRIAGSDL